nr:MAG TPA: DNA-directed DNA polymerase [Caudoviricetes sp.]
MGSNYTVYHLHSELSLLDSCTNYKLYVDRAKELGQKSICFTEHGNCYNWIEKKMYCEKNGIKYLHGVEMYLTKALLQTDDNNPEPHKVRDNYHTILIAKNEAGVREINTLIDIASQEDHTYYKHRISFDEFFNISDNVIKISACLASPLNKIDMVDNAVLLDRLLRTYDYYEIQPHVNSSEQKEYNDWLVKMSKKYKKPLIAGTDTHSINNYKAECRSILMKAKKIGFSNEDQFDLTYKSYDELVEMFRQQGVVDEEVYLQAIENTNVMADSVETFELDTSFKYPKLYGEKDIEVMKQRINTMYKDKRKRHIISDSSEYRDRIYEEMRVFEKVGMVGFMLFMSELVCWCWDNAIPIGPCRGSVGGSEVAYITGIIDVDPVVWHTVFSRFCNEDRKEIGDIDIDVSPSQRHLVYDYIINRFGQDKTAYILAIGTISDKGTIDEIGRALEIPLGEVEKIKKEYEANPETTKQKYPDVFYYFDGLLNTAISQSMHPAGIIASPVTLPDNYGTFWSEGKRILQVNMEEVHEVSLVKYDILGLKNIEICKDTCKFAGIKYPRAHELNWNDSKVWDDIITSPVGIFQFEGDYAFDLLQKYKPTMINHLSLVNASLRPSGASYRDRLIAKEVNHNPSEIIDELLKDNNGFLVFQEDTIKFLQEICGLSGSDADNIRRAIGRKQADRLQAALPQILEGYCNKSPKPREVAEQEAKEFLQIIEDSSNYQFGYNHSTGYSMIGYMCAYLRYYYPVEFISAYLNNANNDADIVNGTALAKQLDISILNPQFRHSKDVYIPDSKNRAIYKGIASIKYLNAEVAQKMYEMRNAEFATFVDFLAVNPCNSRQTEILIRLGFFREFGKSEKLLEIFKMFTEYGSKKQLSKDKVQLSEKIVLKYATATAKLYKVFDMNGLLAEMCSTLEDKSIPLSEIIKAEIEFLGYVQTTLPRLSDNYYAILDINDKYANRVVKLYRLNNGEILTVKIKGKVFNDNPVEQCNIIKALDISEEPKWGKTPEGEWYRKEETELILKKWANVR